MLKAAICDDSGKDCEFVSGLLREWAKVRDMDVHADTFPSAEAFLFHYAEDKAYDILLLDIEMGGMDGVTLARELRRENDSVQIIFITGYSEYIAEGYEVAALHYLMKPVSREKLFAVLDRAAAKLKQNEKHLTLTVSGEMTLIPLRKIRYLDVYGNYVTVHTDEEYTVKRALNEFIPLLDERFVKVGRAQIINLNYITRVTKTEVVLKSGEKLPLPRGAYEQLNRAIIERT